ncbi:MAG TPA: hypothetical protein VGR45_11685 [Stellaceae bacterium]|nr:hypothetical protein [Stellaceae bacterium]
MQNFCGRLPATVLGISVAALAALSFVTSAAADGRRQPFLPDMITSSTIPLNGDLNPYGVAIVPRGFPSGGIIAPGDVLVSNFNDLNNNQGAGTTIIKLTPNGLVAPAVPPGQPGNASVFFQGSGLGLTTALGVLRRGFVLVGNVPTSGGVIQQPGSLLFLDRNGNQVAPSPYTNQLNGPWDLTIDDEYDHALVFVSNVNSGTVTRLNLAISSAAVKVTSATVIASGYSVAPNAAALILGPTGLAYDEQTDILYVASTNDNMIFAVPRAGRRTASSGTGAIIFNDPHLRGPLALVFAPNGDLLTANGDATPNADPTQPSEIVEFTKTGKFVTQFNVDAGQGGAFGMAVANISRDVVRFVYIDDVANDVTVLDRKAQPGD